MSRCLTWQNVGQGIAHFVGHPTHRMTLEELAATLREFSRMNGATFVVEPTIAECGA